MHNCKNDELAHKMEILLAARGCAKKTIPRNPATIPRKNNRIPRTKDKSAAGYETGSSCVKRLYGAAAPGLAGMSFKHRAFSMSLLCKAPKPRKNWSAIMLSLNHFHAAVSRVEFQLLAAPLEEYLYHCSYA